MNQKIPAQSNVLGPSDREMLGMIKSIQTDPLRFLAGLSQKYGEISHFMVAKLPVFVLSSPEGVKHVLQDQNQRYSKDTIQYNALASITGRGLLTNDGESWLRQRRLAQPAFARSRLINLDQIVVPAVQKLLERWETLCDQGQIIDVDQEMMRLTLEIVGKALFNIDLSQQASTLTHSVLTTLDYIVYRAKNILTLPLWMPTRRNREFIRGLAYLDQTVYRLMAERRKSGESGDDLLGMLLQARDPDTNQPMSDLQIRDEVMTMLIAGHETVASALTWTWMLLAQDPSVRQTLRHEIGAVLNDRYPTTTDLSSLPYTGQVFSEALRLYPPAWVISRKAIEEDEVNGVTIPENSLVILSPYVVHRNVRFWSDPEAFNPEHFSPRAEINRFAYIPFGAGPRLCIGSQFAQIEAQLILAMITQRFWLKLASDTPPQVDALVTLRPHGGLHMRIQRY